MYLQILLISSFATAHYSSNFDKYFSNCQKNGIRKNTCAIQYLNRIRPYLKDGSKELGLPSYEPLVFPPLTIAHESQKLKMTAQFFDLSFYNFTNYEILDYYRDDEKVFEDIYVPSSTMTSSFSVNGSILIMPLSGKGSYRVSMPSLRMKNTIYYKIVSKNGKRHCKILDVDVKMTISDLHYEQEGLVGGNLTTAFLNANSKILAKEASIIFGDIFKTFGKQKNENACANSGSVFLSIFFM